MANEKRPPSSSTARKTTRKRSENVAEVPVTSESVNTAQSTTATARNAVIEGNATIDLDQVRRRAFELYEQRGRVDGYEAEDWLRAEQELRNGKRSA